ncbi:protein kinase [Dactylosporangium roseum]|uniref:non-specific serine/threonine protein kinase n=2 Tax=Dactylosporangium roseum TaxID=47989 RepID=A0ABY5Z295_9ACTN|nr:serine/threonine-protein kinase [Dactylosporangium roseum]UWZ36140.1 protein kinase [Dactylosporangium roseum]
MSVVWRAYDEVLERAVAVKLLAPKLLADPDSRRRIQTEARAAALLSHPHIATVHDFGHTPDGAPFVVMELVTGRSLEDRLATGALSAAEAMRLGAQLASALAAVHARGLVHRDVKPANVMLTEGGAKLVDFGISAVAGDTTDQHDELLGTPAYLAPERLRGLPTAAATDVYALGLVLYKMLTGRLPWAGDTTTEVLNAHNKVRPAPLPPEVSLPRPVASAILRCLAKWPENRPTAAEMASVLQRSAPTRPILALHRHPALTRSRLVAAGAVALALGGAGSCAAWNPASADSDPNLVAAAATPDTTETAAPSPGIDCLVRYTVQSESKGAFAADLSLTNTGAADVQGWALTFQLADGQTVGSVGPGSWQQEGTTVRVIGTSAIAPGAEQRFSVTGSYRVPQALPTGFALNDTGCQQVLIAAATVITRVATPGGSSGGSSSSSSKGSSGGSSGKSPKKPKEKDKDDDD